MPEAVIVAATRSPIGRANKGHLVDVRPDDLAAHVVSRVLDKVPQLDRRDRGPDLRLRPARWRAGPQPGARRVHPEQARLAGRDRQPLLLELADDHAHGRARDRGRRRRRVPVGRRRVRLALRQRHSDPRTARNPRLVPGNTEGMPDIYISMGETAENVAEREGSAARSRTATRSRARTPRWPRSNGFFDREIIPVPLPNGEMFSKDDGPRPGTTMEVLGGLKPAFREDGTVTAGNACPLNDGAAAVVVMSDRGRASSASSRWRGWSPPGCRRSSPSSWASARSTPRSRRSSAPT